jgi:predicted small lipoprotein YifL
MKSKIGKLFAALAITLLASCAQMGPLEAQNANIRTAAEHARTYADHDRLARQYESTAKELLVKAEEQKKLLQHYEEKSYLYGRQAQDHQSHTSALLNKYQQAAAETIKQAAVHHKIAAELAKGDHAAQLSNKESKARIETNPEDWNGNPGKTL